MSNAKKCDFCGAYYDISTEITYPYDEKKLIENHVVKIGYYSARGNWNTIDEFDLCSKCLFNLWKYIENIQSTNEKED